MDYRKMTAPCGLDCFNCPAYHANESEEIRNMVAQKFREDFSIDVPPDKAVCRGCRNENGIFPLLNRTEPCNVYKCISEKGFEFCSDCPDFPCDHLHPYADMAVHVPHNTKVFNLSLINKMGVESWAKQKAASVRETYFNGKWKI